MRLVYAGLAAWNAAIVYGGDHAFNLGAAVAMALLAVMPERAAVTR